MVKNSPRLCNIHRLIDQKKKKEKEAVQGHLCAAIHGEQKFPPIWLIQILVQKISKEKTWQKSTDLKGFQGPRGTYGRTSDFSRALCNFSLLSSSPHQTKIAGSMDVESTPKDVNGKGASWIQQDVKSITISNASQMESYK